MRLDDYKADFYSQFGEDGCIAHIFDVLGDGQRVCVEFGAGDGVTCSNTAHLWLDQGWRAVLVEPDPAKYDELEGNARLHNVICRRSFITPTGPDSIDAILEDEEIEHVDFMSIDVDGDDYFILQQLEVRPRVISIEFNPTVPPHLEIRQRQLGENFGASVLAITRLAQSMGYAFVGATYCNAFLVDGPEAGAFAGYVKELGELFVPAEFGYAVTDYAGRVVIVGKPPPWTAKEPYVLPLEGETYFTPPSDSVQQIRRGFESVWGPSRWLSPNGLSNERLLDILGAGEGRPRLVCIDLSTADMDSVKWMWEVAEATGYRTLLFGRVLGLTDGRTT